MWKPLTMKLTLQSKRTFIRNAVIPKVTIESGRNSIWRTGFINVFTIPMTIAVTMAANRLSNSNPLTKYETTMSAKTLIASLKKSFINIIIYTKVMFCQHLQCQPV